MKTIALFNLKGGVGKTSTAVNLACAAGKAGVPTLLWDLDAQGAASYYLLERSKKPPRVKALIKEKIPIGRVIRQTAYPWVDVIPSVFSNRNMDILLSERSANTDLLKQLAAPLSESYGLLIFDCPPSLSRLAEQIFRASDALLLPVVPSPLSLRACEQVQQYCKRLGVKRKRIFSFFSMVDRRRQLHKQWLEDPPEGMPNPLTNYLPYASIVERMGIDGEPLVISEPNHPITRIYLDLWQEISKRVKV